MNNADSFVEHFKGSVSEYYDYLQELRELYGYNAVIEVENYKNSNGVVKVTFRIFNLESEYRDV